MKKFLKFTKGRRGSNSSIASQKSENQSVTGSTPNLTGGVGATSASAPNLRDASSPSVPGYQIVKVKDLPKLHKAAWTGDLKKVTQLAKKDPNVLDKENR